MQQDVIVAFLGDNSILKSGKNMQKNILLSSFRAFSLSTPRFHCLSTPVDKCEATWKKATKCNKWTFPVNKKILIP